MEELENLKNEWIILINGYDTYDDKIEWNKKLKELEIKINNKQKEMQHKITYEKGKQYWIDEEVYGKKYKVTLKHFWKPTMVFALVVNEKGYEWETMLNRLTEIE